MLHYIPSRRKVEHKARFHALKFRSFSLTFRSQKEGGGISSVFDARH